MDRGRIRTPSHIRLMSMAEKATINSQKQTMKAHLATDPFISGDRPSRRPRASHSTLWAAAMIFDG